LKGLDGQLDDLLQVGNNYQTECSRNFNVTNYLSRRQARRSTTGHFIVIAIPLCDLDTKLLHRQVRMGCAKPTELIAFIKHITIVRGLIYRWKFLPPVLFDHVDDSMVAFHVFTRSFDTAIEVLTNESVLMMQ
jgi:hypothetical protein